MSNEVTATKHEHFSVRLTEDQKSVIIENVQHYFGSETGVWLFGSRTDDSQRGGDFDFYLETPLTDAESLFEKRLQLLMALHDTPAFADEKIDLVIHTPLSLEPSPIAQQALSQGIRLA